MEKRLKNKQLKLLMKNFVEQLFIIVVGSLLGLFIQKQIGLFVLSSFLIVSSIFLLFLIKCIISVNMKIVTNKAYKILYSEALDKIITSSRNNFCTEIFIYFCSIASSNIYIEIISAVFGLYTILQFLFLIFTISSFEKDIEEDIIERQEIQNRQNVYPFN